MKKMNAKPEFTPTREEMLDLLGKMIQPIARSETLPLERLSGRVAAKKILSRNTLPNTKCASRDGIGLCFNRIESDGANVGSWVEGDQFVFCNTGCAMPEPYDTFLEIESVSFDDGGRLTLSRLPKKSGEGVIAIGSNMRAGETLAEAGEMITPALVAILASGGVLEAEVLCKPRVAFIPTGDELTKCETNPVPLGKNVESNSWMVSAYLREWNCELIILPVAADVPEALRAVVHNAVSQADLALICAGSSKGSKDFTIQTLREMGEMHVKELSHGPGKHVSLFIIEGIPVLGIPGPSGGAELATRLYVKTAVNRLQMQPVPQPNLLEAELTKPLNGIPMDFIVRLRVYFSEGKWLAEPISFFGMGFRQYYSSANAQYYLKKNVNYNAGDRIYVELLTKPDYL